MMQNAKPSAILVNRRANSSEAGSAPPPLEEMDIVELQGTLSVPEHLQAQAAGSSDDDTGEGSSAARSSGRELFLGTIERQGAKKATLNIGTLVVEGEVNPYKKKILILRRIAPSAAGTKRPREDGDSEMLQQPAEATITYPEEPITLADWLATGDNDARVTEAARVAIENAADRTREYEVAGVAVNHFLFKAKPARIFK